MLFSIITSFSFLFGALVAQAAPASPAPATAPVAALTIPAHSHLSIHLSSLLTSDVATTGQSFGFFVDQDTVLNGVSVPKCTPGTGTIAFAERSGGSGREGTLRLRFDALTLADGTTVGLDKTEQEFKGQDQHGKAARHRLGMYLLCGLLCQGGGANAVSGMSVAIPMDKELVVEVADDTLDHPSATPAALVCPTPAPAPTATPAP